MGSDDIRDYALNFYLTYFLHLSHALLTLVRSLSSLRRFAGGERWSLDSAFEGVVAEVAAASARS